MNLASTSNELLQKEPPLWKVAPIWRKTFMLAMAATVASASLFLIGNPGKNPQKMDASQAQGSIAEKPRALDDSGAKQTPLPPPTDSPAVPPSIGVVAEAKLPMPVDGFGNKGETAPSRNPTPIVTDQKPLLREKIASHLRTQPGLPAASKNVPVLEAHIPPQNQLAEALPSEPADTSCPELVRLMPQTEPYSNEDQVMEIRSADSSLHVMRRSMDVTHAAVDTKYQYQIVAAMSPPRNAVRPQQGAFIPADLRVLPGDIVRWDGAYRDQPGRCHYVPARVRAVLRHAELPMVKEIKEVTPTGPVQ